MTSILNGFDITFPSIIVESMGRVSRHKGKLYNLWRKRLALSQPRSRYETQVSPRCLTNGPVEIIDTVFIDSRLVRQRLCCPTTVSTDNDIRQLSSQTLASVCVRLWSLLLLVYLLDDQTQAILNLCKYWQRASNGPHKSGL